MNLFSFTKHSWNYSPLRSFEYEELPNVKLKGKILDLGGGKRTSYLHLLRGEFSLVSLNIDLAVEPTHVADITKKFPLKANTFDGAISLNTFEHILDFDTALQETHRVLKPASQFAFCIPWLHQLHGSPEDYWRYSPSALAGILKRHGFAVKKIVPLGKGIFVARYSLLFGAYPRVIRPLFACFAWKMDWILSALSKRYRKASGNYALGYFVYAVKR